MTWKIEMQLLYNNYTALQTQVQQARAKLTLQTPAFTTLQVPPYL